MPLKTSEIKFTVELDENKVPSKILWEASDSGIEGKKDANAIMISVWDPKEQATLRIDLWTKEMPVDDMKRFYYETLCIMSDTLGRATGETELAKEMRAFADRYGKKISS
jgi:gliding motility-associated protein GldC